MDPFCSQSFLFFTSVISNTLLVVVLKFLDLEFSILSICYCMLFLDVLSNALDFWEGDKGVRL